MSPTEKSQKSGKVKRDFKSLDDALQANLDNNRRQHLEVPRAVVETTRTVLVRVIPLDRIEPNPYNPRHYFDPAELEKLADSMLEDGQLQNVLVRPHPTREGWFQLVFGERRFRAASLPQPKYNNLKQLTCDVRELDDYQMARLAVIENTQRQDVAAIARARGYKTMYDTAQRIGQPRTWEQIATDAGFAGKRSVLRYVQMLDLPPEIVDRMEALNWSEKHGRALLSVDELKRRQLARDIERDELSGSAAQNRADELGQKRNEKARQIVVSPGTPSATRGSAHEGAPNSETPGETSRSGLFEIQSFEIQSSGTSTRSAAEEILNDLREVNSRLGRAATTLEGGTASTGLRRDIAREMELIEENLARVKAKV